MRTWLLALLAAFAGVAVGVGITVAEFAPAEEIFVVSADSEVIDIDPAAGVPRAVVEGSKEYDFGVMERNVQGKHAFIVRNEGTAPLTVKVGQTSCKCTVAALKDDKLAPGESTKVELEWEAKGYQEDFRQTAEVQTNDPANPVIRLAIYGNIIQSVRPIPEEIDLHGIPVNEETEAEVKVYGFTNEALELRSHSLVNPEYADKFELSARPLEESEYADVVGAKSGYAVRLKVKSGLPVGPLNQTIRLETNVPAAEVIEVPVHLTVASDISIINASPGVTFVSDKNLLRVGKLKSDKGATLRLFIMVKGPHRQATELSVGKVEPAEYIRVKLGEVKSLRDGAVLQYPLEIDIPPGSRALDRMGGEQGELGKIILQTTHPVAKEVRIFVQFAVE